MRSVGNSVVLQETCLVEAFNPKAAIEYNMGTVDAAKEALSELAPRQEGGRGPVAPRPRPRRHPRPSSRPAC